MVVLEDHKLIADSYNELRAFLSQKRISWYSNNYREANGKHEFRVWGHTEKKAQRAIDDGFKPYIAPRTGELMRTMKRLNKRDNES